MHLGKCLVHRKDCIINSFRNLVKKQPLRATYASGPILFDIEDAFSITRSLFYFANTYWVPTTHQTHCLVLRMETKMGYVPAFMDSSAKGVSHKPTHYTKKKKKKVRLQLQLWWALGKRDFMTPCYIWIYRVWGLREQNCVFLEEPKKWSDAKEGKDVLCTNWEHPEKLIKTFLFDYTLEDGNSFLSRLSLTQLAQEECKGWVGSSPTWEWKEATYQRDDCLRAAAAANSTSTLWDNCLAIFQRQRQLTGKKKKMHLTTSLSGGLDKSGTHCKVAFKAEIYVALQTSVLGVPRAQVCIYA